MIRAETIARVAFGRGPACRRFTLLDGMILVAGLGVGFAGCRSRIAGVDFGEGVIDATFDLAGYSLMLLSALMLAFRLRRPRPTIARVARQPGSAACLAAVIYGLLFDVECMIEREPGDLASLFETFEEGTWFLIDAPVRQFAYMVPILWLLMALGRTWRPEPGWIDGAGRLVGLGWVGWAVAGLFR